MREPAFYDCAFVILRLNTGGAERQLVEVAKGLAARGRRVAVITLSKSALGVEELRSAGVLVRECDPEADGFRASCVPRAVMAIRHLRPRTVVGFMTHGNMVARLARLGGAAERVINGFRAGFEKPAPRLIYRVSGPLCDLDVTNSASMASGLIEQGVVRPARNLVIENGVNLARYAPDAAAREAMRAELDLGGAFVWIMVAVMRRDRPLHGGTAAKRFDLLLPAFARLSKEGADARLLLVGDGELRPEVEASIAALGLRDTVTLLGRRLDVERVLNAADAMVLATDYEGMPNAILEAFATGLPVVSNDVAGVRDLVTHHSTGYLAKPGDTTALYLAMKTLMALPDDERTAIGQRALTRAREFSYERTVDRWERAIVAESKRGS